MTVPVQCAHCKQSYNLAESMLGKNVRCKACQKVFEVRREKPTQVSAGPPRARSGASAASAPPPVRRRELDDVEVVDDDDDDRDDDRGYRDDRDRPRKKKRKREREGSSATMWIVSGVVGVVCFVIAFVVVFLLMRRSAQPQVAQAPPANPGVAVAAGQQPGVQQPGVQQPQPGVQQPGVQQPQPGVQQPIAQPPLAQPPVQQPQVGGNFPGAEIAPPGFYGDQGGEPVMPADPGLPGTLLRASAEETFYRLSNARIGSPTSPFGTPRPGQALLVDYEVTRRGKHRGNTLIIHSAEGGRSTVSLLGFGGRERGTIQVTTFGGPFRSFPKNAEIYVQRHDGRYGKEAPTFKVSNSVILGAMPVVTKARNWTKDEIERFSKEPPAPPNYANANAHPKVGKDTQWIGDVKGGGTRRYVEPEGHLLGVEVRLSEWEKEKCIGSITPVFSHDQPTSRIMKRVMAKEGYAVAGAEVHTGRFVTGIKLIYHRLNDDGTLDAKDSYTSELLGYEGTMTKLGETGRPAIGIHIRQGAITNAMALVMRE